MQYFFRQNVDISESIVKSKFKAIFTTNKTPLFSAMKAELKTQLQITGTNQLDKFQTLIDNTSSDLYKFIQIK